MRATVAGVILGTAAYMPPEQAKGKDVDRRADIWAFGVVLYEMLTGRLAFRGETITDVLAAVVKEEPDMTQVPAEVRRLLKVCLEKDPKLRLQWIGDWKLLLDDARPASPQQRANRIPWVVAAAFALVALGTGVAYFRHTPEQPRSFRVSMHPPEKAFFAPGGHAVSPDGRHVAFVATVNGKDSLWVRDLDSLISRQLAGTESASNPFWSPDSRFVAFFADGKLKKIEATGGPALSLCDTGFNPAGGSWSQHDVIVFSSDIKTGLFRVSAAGGVPAAVTKLDQAFAETTHAWPWFLPDGRHFLYTATSIDKAKTAMYVEDIEAKPGSNGRRRVLGVNSNAVYVSPGYLMFVRDGTLMAQPADAANAQPSGDPIPIADRVDFLDLGYASPIFRGQFSVSQNGVLIYTSGLAQDRLLTLFDRSGKAVGTVGGPGRILSPQFSPDGNSVVIDRFEPDTGGDYDLWIHDLKRGTSRRLTFHSRRNYSPVWSPDGRHIAFTSTREGDGNLYQKETGGAGKEEALDKTPSVISPNDWSRDGRYILSTKIDPKTGKFHVWVTPVFGDRKPFTFLETEFGELNPRLSPNGRWLAYVSDETGRSEIYVQTFPTPGAKSQVSTNGGNNPAWNSNGKELFFAAPDRKLMVVEVKAEAEFQAGVPKPLFEMHNGFDPLGGWFDVSRDGRFMVPTEVAQDATVPMTVWTNWTAALKK
jgi:Tol biopolymer transport system component